MTVRVTEHRASSIYCNVIEKILLTHIHRLVKIESESENAANFESDNDDKEYMYVYESDDEDEIRSEASRKSEDENENDDEDMKEDDEDSDDDMNDDEDNVYNSIWRVSEKKQSNRRIWCDCLRIIVSSLSLRHIELSFSLEDFSCVDWRSTSLTFDNDIDFCMKRNAEYARSLIVYYTEKRSAQKMMRKFSIMLLIVWTTSEYEEVVAEKALLTSRFFKNKIVIRFLKK